MRQSCLSVVASVYERQAIKQGCLQNWVVHAMTHETLESGWALYSTGIWNTPDSDALAAVEDVKRRVMLAKRSIACV